MQSTALNFGIFALCFVTYAGAENAYGDHGIVFTAVAAMVDENYQNIVSVPSTPMDIDNTTEQYPGFNFDFVFRRPFSCDVDYSKNELYVYDYYLKALLLLQNYNSSATKETITITRQHNGISPEYAHVAVDWISHNIYWTDPLLNWIAMQPGGALNDPTRYKVIQLNLKLPRGLAVDPIAGYLFWTEYAREPRIERTSLTGALKTTIVHQRLTQPNSIVVDHSARRIYWSDEQYLDSATYEGTERRHIRGTNVNYFDVALFENVLITTDLYSFYNGASEFYARFYDKTTGKEITDKRISTSREIFFGTCMYHGDLQPPQPEQDRCKNATCEHICVNEPDKATCLCSEGFELESDGSCKEKGGQYHRALVISTGKSLCLLDIRVLSDKHDFTPFCFYNGTDNDNITIFDVNMILREVYFATGSTINKVTIETQEKTIIEEMSYNITGMSYDSVRNRLYFGVASDPHKLWFLDMNTGSPKDQHDVSSGDLRSLTIVPSQNKIYWLAGVNLLQSVDLDADANTEITNLTFVYHPVGLQIYPKRLVHDKKYEEFLVLIEGLDGHSDLLGIDYNGNATDYLPTVADITDFAIYKEFIVLINHKDGKYSVRSADLGLGFPLKTVDEGTIKDIDQIYAVKILDADLQEQVTNPCGPSSNNGGCEHVCIVSDDAATCKCKLGYILHTDGKQCLSNPVSDDFIVVTDLSYNELVQIPFSQPNTAIGIRTPTVDRPDGVLYNYQTGEILWTSTTAAKIWAVFLNGSRVRLVSNVDESLFGYPDQLALDPSTGNIFYTTVSYYSDSLYDSLIVVRNTRGEETIVIWEGHRPRDIEIDPAEGVMFWTDYSGSFTPAVFRANMDGTDKRYLHTENVTWPNGIAVDHLAKRIYWTDGYLDMISYSDYDGNNRNMFMKVESGLRLMDLELVGDYLYFTSMGSQRVTRVNKNNEKFIDYFGPEAGLGRLYGLDVYSSSAQTNTPVNTGCATDHGGCSHFCLPNVGGYSCGCNMYVDLLADLKTCADVPRCPMFPNGDIIEDPTCVGVEGNKCAYTCDRGYKRRESVSKISCSLYLNQLNWDVRDPCEMVTCPDYIENGLVDRNCSKRPDAVCTYDCSDGFVPNKNLMHIMCEPNGQWNYTANVTVLCSLRTTTTESESVTSSSKDKIAVGVGVGIGALVLIVIIVIVVVFLIRSGRIGKSSKSTTGASFENPRYANNDVQLGETNASFGYSTLDEDKVAATATNTAYDNIQPRI